MVPLVFMIIFIALTFGIFGFSIFKAMRIVKNPMPKTIQYSSEIKNFLFLNIGVAVSTVLIFVFLAMAQLYKLPIGDWASLIFGSLIFGFSLSTFILSFIVHYYGKEIDPKNDKILFYSMIGGALLTLVGLLLLTNGLADHVSYPLVNGLNFTKGFVTPLADKSNSGGIMWYALCILTGAILVYFICDHRFYKEYGKHGILESTFFIAFPAGIIGARVGYVIGEWEHGGFAERVANGEWWSIFAVWEGGLTIISGALTGIIVGVLWFLWRNKKYSIWFAVDVIVPTILVAQAIGRWGNFFNCEVHGVEVNAANWWFLPKMILNNARYSSGADPHWAASGNIFAPLFYVEFLSNLAGYFIIRFLIGKELFKYLEEGDLAASYIMWYGLTRVIMEPMRHTEYNMGNDGYWSWMWSIIFVLGSAFLIMVNHVIRAIIRRVKKKAMVRDINFPLAVSIGAFIFIASMALVILGSIFMGTSVQSNFLGFNRFNNGFIILTVGLSLTLLLVCDVIYIVQSRLIRHEN